MSGQISQETLRSLLSTGGAKKAKKSSKKTSKKTSKRASKKTSTSKKTSKKSKTMTGGKRGGTEYIKKQSELAKYITKTLNVKGGIPMVSLISYLRKEASKGKVVDAVASLKLAKDYFDANKSEAKRKYDEFASKPRKRKSKKNV